MIAGELVRVAARTPRGVVDPYTAHCPDCLGPGLRPAQFRVQLDRLDDLVADRIDRVQRGHRLLEDHRDVAPAQRSEEHTSELQSRLHLVCRLLLEKKKRTKNSNRDIARRHTYT